MRKTQKYSILEVIRTIHQVHDEIKKYIDTNQYMIVQELIAECQECAISIGTEIEKLEGKGVATLSLIEDYCEFLYCSYENMKSSAGNVNANKMYKSLKKRLMKIENSINHDISIRKEIVFFPYKVSMWDALESVYFAKRQESDCDVYCVPIPYFEKNPDGSLGQMHYEGKEYPHNIDVVDWETYNYEERNPDTIYIHNAYDNWNLVTCVHPRFFSRNLKAHTDELIYVPYFILKEIEPDNQIVIDKMKHFCFLPGIINADKVIVQSEKMKQIYVNEYFKAAKINGLQGAHVDRKRLEQKFLGLGSPKIDKVKNTKKEDLEIPDEWLKIIEKPDKSWKKIVFYNTSISALLENNETMLEKMNYVFHILKEQKDEVALLWRPHPLIQNTISSIRPLLWRKYEEIVCQYKKEGWGIYDDTSNVDRAVILSDIYYGDHSSVVQLCQAAGKRVIIQNVNVREFNKSELLSGTGCAVKADKIFIPSFNINLLLECSLTSKEIRMNKLNAGNGSVYTHLYTDIKFDGDKAYLAPAVSEKFAVLDSKTAKIEYITIDRNLNHLIKYYQDVPFIVPLFSKRYLFYVGINQTSTVVRYDLEKSEICYFENESIQRYGDNDRLYSGEGVVVGNDLMLPLYNQSKFLAMDVTTGEGRIIDTIGQINEHLRTVDKVGELLYFSTDNGTIFSWDCYEEKVIQIIREGNGAEFIHSIVVWDKIYYYPLDEAVAPISYVSLTSNEYREFGMLPSYFCSATYDPIRDNIVLNTGLGIYMQSQDGMMTHWTGEIPDWQINELRKSYQKNIISEEMFLEGNPKCISLEYLFKTLWKEKN